jgi:hypothetical protein
MESGLVQIQKKNIQREAAKPLKNLNNLCELAS